MNIFIYFHGHGSSADCYKVKRMRELGLEVYAWDINIDPSISLPYLKDKIQDLLVDHLQEMDLTVTMIGSSLGCWYADRLGKVFNCRTFMINPSFAPEKNLLAYGVPPEIASKYKQYKFTNGHFVTIAKGDIVIDYAEAGPIPNVTYVDGSDHRFSGPEFDDFVLNMEQNLIY